MRLLRECVEPGLIENIVTKEDKDVLLRGVFAQADIKNKNGRIYPLHIMEREAKKIQGLLNSVGVCGSCDHPLTPDYNLADAAIKINYYKQDGKNFIGEAKVLRNTIKGATLYTLCKEGIKIGMSTRGLGSVEERDDAIYVKDDFNLITIDAVAQPSAEAWVESILEHTEYYIDNGCIKEDKAMTYIKQIKNLKSSEIKEGIVSLFDNFLKGL